jgi:hypothetical protein
MDGSFAVGTTDDGGFPDLTAIDRFVARRQAARVKPYLLALIAVLTACQSGESKSPPPAPQAQAQAPTTPSEPTPTPPPSLAVADEDAYRDDIARLCDVMSLSGADQLDEGSRMVTVANWLGSNLATDAGHDFLIAMQLENDGRRKGEILRSEASRLGLPPCKLAESWN